MTAILCTDCGYPKSVAKAKLWPVWDLKQSAGANVAAPAKLPAQFLTADGPALTQNAVIATTSNRGLLLGLGITDGGLAKGSPQAVYEDSTFDGTGLTNATAAAIETSGKGSLTLRRVRFANIPRVAIFWSGGTFVGEDVYFGPWGQNPRLADHLEPAHVEAGDFTLDRFFVDGDSWRPWPVTTAGETGGFFGKAGAGPATIRLMRGLITGSATHHWPYPIQLKAQVADVDLYIGGTGLERGTSGYIGPAELNGHKVRVHDLGGNFDLVTGAPITLG